MSNQTVGLAVVQWPVKDIERSLSWYQTILGVSLTFPYTPGDDAAWLNLGNVGFGLVQTAAVPQLDYQDIHGARRPLVQFQVDNIHDVHLSLRDKGIEASDMRFIRGGGHSFTIIDPDGNAVSLWGGWPSEDEDGEER